MKIILIRHAKAEDRSTYARKKVPDAFRPLTSKGATEMRDNARGLAAVVPHFDVLATSPFFRAAQTAQIIHDRTNAPVPTELSALKPGQKPATLQQWLKKQKKSKTIGLIGHEPSLSQLAAYYLIGKRTSFLELKKGGALLIEFSGAPLAGKGRATWLLQPGHLQQLARRRSPIK